ncbi:MAG: hypothetical protein U9N57_01135 [Pseudomonadota bacterium]|nr:hypothetical protein [Pseudomonadota bacterium]
MNALQIAHEILTEGQRVLKEGLPNTSIKETGELLGLFTNSQRETSSPRYLLAAWMLGQLGKHALKKHQDWMNTSILDLVPRKVSDRKALRNGFAHNASARTKQNIEAFLVDGKPLSEMNLSYADQDNLKASIKTAVGNLYLSNNPNTFNDLLKALSSKLTKVNAKFIAGALLIASPQKIDKLCAQETKPFISEIVMLHLATLLSPVALEKIESTYVDLLERIETIRVRYGIEINNIGKMRSEECKPEKWYLYFDQKLTVNSPRPPSIEELADFAEWLFTLFDRPLNDIRNEFLERGCGKLLSLYDMNKINALIEKGDSLNEIHSKLNISVDPAAFYRAYKSRKDKYVFNPYWRK